jgi:cytochrome b involved in lipid metabolism
VVTVFTMDEEEFPVKRRLLRPCLALTSLVQAGRGKYAQPAQSRCEDSSNSNNPETQDLVNRIVVPVDACTFDRVLLYLEHEIRGETFKFDPLIAADLLEAAISLKIQGLQDTCEKVLGSFAERVRKVPIRLQEVLDRNEQGRLAALDPMRRGKRGETLLILSGMVFDITRWLDEHPGGSTIIPEQALNMDCTVFFEIYHASRQSFLYLKEFYIGEIAEEDLALVPLPPGDATPSAAFVEQLARVTGWRLRNDQLIKYHVHKSF